MAELELRKFLIPEMIFGRGAHTLVGQYARRFEMTRALLVSDAGVMEAGWTEGVRSRLADSGISALIFADLTSNPKDHEVTAGVTRYMEGGCDGIVAVGGGSPMDCAKGIGIVCSNGGDILDYIGVDKVPMPMPPLICVPTTAGSAADISQFAVISDHVRMKKEAIISKSVVPDLSLIDPALTETMGRELTAWTAMDALIHAVESYVSNASSPFTDLLALNAVRLVAGHMIPSVQHPTPESRDGMMLASTEAGMAFSNASLGAVHAMAHSLGALLDNPHGESSSVLLEKVIAYNYPAIPRRYRDIALALGIDSPGDPLGALLEWIHTLRRATGLGGSLRDLGLQRSEMRRLAEEAIDDPCMVTNPRRPTVEEIEAIYDAAF
ncbi:iron-containing alcohol dehydrogenase [Geomonas sp. RF6]|uniref:iron-containing alcohol dehydrogenase n=1 Tax=Geomonas sp. RF6 TaxID=2897342 RepID=UPI001E4C017A|nr:iron-containing alcohol dehydrogenase [Geomonas sp. RF6]UFS68604.1 iron-containing alcohol dehydrogenase [Geomonas sp. RF6]